MYTTIGYFFDGSKFSGFTSTADSGIAVGVLEVDEFGLAPVVIADLRVDVRHALQFVEVRVRGEVVGVVVERLHREHDRRPRSSPSSVARSGEHP